MEKLECDTCGAGCIGSDRPEEPCYGEALTVIEDWADDEEGEPQPMCWVHTCVGHRRWPDEYLPKGR